MKRAYKYRLYPNKTQEAMLRQSFDCCRFIYNATLAAKIKAYEADKTTLSKFDCIKLITGLKEEHEWLRVVPHVCLPQAVYDMDSAYQQFFKIKQGYPKFKSKHRSKLSCRFSVPFCSVDQETRHIKLPKIGLIKYKQDRRFKGQLRNITVSCDGCGRYWVSCLVETGVLELKPAPITSQSKCVGLDLGLKDFIVTSDGRKIPNPRFADVIDRRISRLQKIESRRQKGSRRRAEIRLKINKLYAKKRNLINNFIHHTVNSILGENQAVFIEDLNVKGMMGNHSLAKSIQNICWSEFVRVLDYKARWLGKTVLKIDRFFPSSKTCGCCGYKNDGLTLKDRSWTCPQCGTVHDRDLNAAINILRAGLVEILPSVGRFEGRGDGGYEVGETPIYAV
jgi:putative transposase